MTRPPRSEMFDDVYFSALGGLEETRHVFIDGNNLPARWVDQSRFTVCETGFGTGLNFLTAWALFEETAPADAVLDYISFEKYPLKPEDIKTYLAPWNHVFGSRLDHLCREYPMRAPGFHRIVFLPRVILTLIFDDVNEALPELEANVDCWFLDGFTPAKNPEMWTQTVFENMVRLSNKDASFATFTAAGDVRRGLEQAGFEVRKEKGFAHKRDMLCGRFTGPGREKKKKHKSVSILGGGLAGTACAHVFQQYGLDPVLYEKTLELGAGASGNQTGLYNPRLTALRDPVSNFYAPAFMQGLRSFSKSKDIDFHPCGALHLVTNEDKKKRFAQTAQNWSWQEGALQYLNSDQASDIAGIELDHEALYLPQSGSINPKKLCEAYAEGTEIYFNKTPALEELKTDAVCLANGAGVLDICANLPVHTVRGQVSYVAPTSISQKLKTALCYSGYISPIVNGEHVIGSTFQKWLTHTDILEEDHETNLSKLVEAVPALYGLKAQHGWAALRTTSKDHFPVIGHYKDNVYMSTAHGSHGSLSTLMGAHLLADLLRGGPLCLPKFSVKALTPDRFFK